MAALSEAVTATAVSSSVGKFGRAAVVSMQGLRANFEDAHILNQDLGIFAVFDGHNGDHASAFCAERLHLHVLAAGEPSQASLSAAFLAADEELRGALVEGSQAGSTAVFATVSADGPDVFKIRVANCGDSRAVLWSQGDLQETFDHKPDRPEEKKRVEAAGGFVWQTSVWDMGQNVPSRIDGQIACSRAIGAFKFKQDPDLKPEAQKVTAAPDLYEWQARKGDWLILACDGIWDQASSEEVMDEIRDKASDGASLGDVLDEILSQQIENGADDNLTLMALQLGVDLVPLTQTQHAVRAGDFLAAKNKHVLDQYQAFCLRFGYSIKKKGDEVCLEKTKAFPEQQYAHLPIPELISVGASESVECDSLKLQSECQNKTARKSEKKNTLARLPTVEDVVAGGYDQSGKTGQPVPEDKAPTSARSDGSQKRQDTLSPKPC